MARWSRGRTHWRFRYVCHIVDPRGIGTTGTVYTIRGKRACVRFGLFCVAGRVTIDDDGLTVHHYAGNGTVVFTAPTVGPRNVSKTARLHAEKTMWERD